MLRVLIVVLAVADGIIHLALNFVLFRGNFWGSLPFPSPLPLPLNQLFTLNFIGYIVLAICFWFGTQVLGARRWLIDVAIMILALLSIIGWVQVGMPNPMGLGYLSKALEVALIVALAVDAWGILHSSSVEERTA
jgi:hypothetical protein